MAIKQLNRLINKNLRYKLLSLVLFPIFLVIPIILGLVAHWSQNFSYEQLFMKVTTDLSVADHAFVQRQKVYLNKLGRLAESYTFRRSLYEKDAEAIRLELDMLRQTGRFDFLHLIDLNGQWLYEPSYADHTSSKPSTLFEQTRKGNPSSGVEIFSQDDLAHESSIETKQLRLTLIDTPHARPIQHTVEDRGMMIRMVYPVMGEFNQIIAMLDGGVLLNRNFEFVDTIRDLVYGPGSLMEGSLGTVTVFLEDVRITTNVPIRPGERALGTRVSQEVRTKVLDLGENWIDRAFVVNDWYISAYEALYDVAGNRVGILYTGFLEAPFRQAHFNAFLALLILFFFVMLISVWLAFRGAESIFRPVEQMTAVVRATHAGEQLRIGVVDSNDEIGELARQFDSMLDELQERNQQILRASEELEQKVEERTSELKSKNEALKRNIDLLNETRKQLVLAEKLASLGELTAGIAHEINNPTAVILGNMELIISELGTKIEPVKMEADLIIEQVYRIRTIVESLLQYSRASESGGYIQMIDVNALIKDTLPLIRHEVETHNANILLDLKSDIPVRMHKQELQQVLINLIVNAVQATPEKVGELQIKTENWYKAGIVIRIKDNGKGIQDDQLDKVFDPFFTTKQKGTGLGLSVSYGLVQRYGGNISVESIPGEGTCFSVWLLQEPKLVGELFSEGRYSSIQ